MECNRTANRTWPWPLVLALLLAAAPPACAQNWQGWPELRLYVQQTPNRRLYFLARTNSGSSSPVQARAGANLDFFLKSRRRRKRLIVFSVAPARSSSLLLRLGFETLHNLSGPTRTEQRGVIELTPRYPLQIGVDLSDRNRLELRWINGASSWRYRNRLELERDVFLGRMRLSPFVRAEVFYDSRYSRWVNTALSAGSTVSLTRHVEAELYYEHRNNTSQSPNTQTNAIGLIVSFYH